MISVTTISITLILYIGFLFAVAYYADKKREIGQSITANSTVYALSIAVHYTSWTFYGFVGQAATHGVSFLAAYLSVTYIAFTWWFFLRKMVRISKEQNILSIADFLASRYGKSPLIGGIVTVFSIVAIVPYIALQLRAITITLNILTIPAKLSSEINTITAFPFNSAFLVALLLAIFGVLFGARKPDRTGHMDGLVAAVALQAVVKLIAFLAVGLFITYGIFDGFADIFTRFTAKFPDRTDLFLLGTPQATYGSWVTSLFSHMAAIMFLPRQFHMMVIENSDEKHIKDAMWRFPVYTFLLTLFVMPIALGGIIIFNGNTALADYFIINIPLYTGHPWLAMFVFIGGFSASAGMIMVEAVVLSTMIHNHLFIPVILRFNLEASDLSGLLIFAKRIVIIAVVLFAYSYSQLIGDSDSLINIGVVTLIAATQFAPPLICGLYWKHATRHGAVTGLVIGSIVWFYTLIVPLLERSGWLAEGILKDGPFGIAILRPLELFGLQGLDMLSHSLFWTMFFNLGACVIISLLTNQNSVEIEQAEKFVDVFSLHDHSVLHKRMNKAPSIVEFIALMTKFVGEKQANIAIAEYLADKDIDEKGSLPECEFPLLKSYTEQVLARSVGATAAGVIVDSYLTAQGSELENVFDIFGTVNISRNASKEQLGILYESARIIASKAELQTILDKILELFQQQFKFDVCVIRTLDEENRCLSIRSQTGMSNRHLQQSNYPLNLETHANKAFHNNSIVVINDSDSMDNSVTAQLVHMEGIKSFVHAPINIEGQTVGLLSAFSKNMKGIFTDEVIELIENIAGQIGIALRNAQQAEKLIRAKEHEKELQIARNIQMSLLPTHPPEIAGISLAGVCIPTKEVGGDYYDFFLREPGSLDLLIADVSGHNVGAALLMAEVRAFIQADAKKLQYPDDILCALNEFIYEDLTRTELFISMFYLSCNVQLGELTFASAGHNPPLLWRSDSQTCEWLDADGLILGVKRSVKFERKRVPLKSGDILLLYTDGITEATGTGNEMFGESRLCSVIMENNRLPTQLILDNLLNKVRSFSGNISLNDDVSVIVVKYTLNHGEQDQG